MTVRASIAAAESTASNTVESEVKAPFRVVHEGVAYTEGDVVEVPNDDEHKIWLQSGWVVKEK